MNICRKVAEPSAQRRIQEHLNRLSVYSGSNLGKLKENSDCSVVQETFPT